MDQIGAPSITDWLMVGITFVYMLFTIGIFIANIWSSKSAKNQLEETKKQMEESKNQFEKQLAETKRQYEESKRLDTMPFLQFDTSSNSLTNLAITLTLMAGDYTGGTNTASFEIKNIGRGTVKDIMYDWENLSGQKTDKEWFPIKSLCSGDLRKINLNFLAPREKPEKEKAVFTFYYTDLLENMYIQPVELFFVKGSLLGVQYKNHNTQPPKYIGKKPNEYNDTIEEQ